MMDENGKADAPVMTPQQLVEELAELIDVRQTGEHDFQGMRKRGGVGRVYGGQVVAQALAAAVKTVDPARHVHSLHSYFLRGGSEDHEIDYHVEADFDGGSFSNRRVIASQQGQVIFNLAASFHRVEKGRFHQPEMPEVPAPEELPTVPQFLRDHPEYPPLVPSLIYRRETPIDVRCVGIPPFCAQPAGDPRLEMWFRAKAPVRAEQWLHRAIVAYTSDFAMISTALRPHGRVDMQGASIDHCVWFHEDVDVGDWLLYTTQSPWAGQARGLSFGQIFDRSGRLVASVAQEGLMRDLSMK